MKLTKLVFKLLMLSLLCSTVPLFSMERAKKIVRQFQGKPEYTKDIFDAAKQGRLDAVKYWVEHGTDINARDADGNTPLILAAQRGMFYTVRNYRTVQENPAAALDVVKYLIEQKADIDAANNEGETALMAARMAHHNRLETVKYLVEHGANKEIKDKSGRTVLMQSVDQHITDVMKYLVEQGADMETKDSHGWTPLLQAARGHPSAPDMFLDTVQYLVEHGANKEASDNYGRRALMIAAESDMLSIVKYLVEQGVDKEAKDKEGLTALMHAARRDHFDIVQYLIDAGANLEAVDYSGKTALVLAFQQDKKSMIQFLIDRGANVGVLVNGSTILMLTAQQGNLDMVKYLVERGADIQAFNGNADILHQLISAIGERTNYWVSQKGGVPDGEGQFISKLEGIVKYLVDKKANLEGKNKDGLTPFLLALRDNQQDLAEYLAKHGANVDARYPDGDTALLKAARVVYIDRLKFLIKLGADIEAKDKNGNTPLIVVALRHFPTEADSVVAKYLIEQGAFMSPATAKDFLNRALNRDDIELLQALENRGFITDFDPNKANADGETLLMQILLKNEPKSVGFLIKKGANPYQEDTMGLNAFDYPQDNPKMLTLLNQTKHTAPAKKAIVIEPESDTKKAIRRLQHIKKAMQPETPKADVDALKTIAAETPAFSGLTQTEAHLKLFGAEVEKKYGKVLGDPFVQRILAREKEAIAQDKYVFYRSEPGKYRVYRYFLEELYRLVDLNNTSMQFVWNRFFRDAAKEPTINEYIKPENARAHKAGPQELNALLSANLALFGNVNNGGESTWDYFLKNFEAKPAELEALFTHVFDVYGFDKKYMTELLNIKQGPLAASSTLQQIIIPKSIVDDVAMISTHGYCFPWLEMIEPSSWDPNALNYDFNLHLKKGRHIKISPILDLYKTGTFKIDDRWQARILMNTVYGLNPGSGIEIYSYTRFPEKRLEYFKNQVTKITDEIFGQWLKELLESKGVPYGAKDEPLGDTLKYLGKGKPKSKL